MPAKPTRSPKSSLMTRSGALREMNYLPTAHRNLPTTLITAASIAITAPALLSCLTAAQRSFPMKARRGGKSFAVFPIVLRRSTLVGTCSSPAFPYPDKHAPAWYSLANFELARRLCSACPRLIIYACSQQAEEMQGVGSER